MNTLQKLFIPSFSAKQTKKNIIIFTLLIVLLAAVVLLSLFLGATKINVFDGFSALFNGNTENSDYNILIYIRLPRVIASLLSGAALAVSGVIIQAVLNNPMASPNIIGVNSGAGLAAAITIAAFPQSISFLPFACFIGALLAFLVIFSFAGRKTDRLTVTLLGIAVGSVLSAAINAIKVLFPNSVYDADVFMIGGFSGIIYSELLPASIIIFICLAIAFSLSKSIDVLCLGRTTAISLGVNIKALNFGLLIVASALSGAAVSFSGLLGFVGLLVPHIARKFVGNRHNLLLTFSALFGGLLVMVCDLLSRIIFAPYEVPVGILLSLIGGIFFVCLVVKRKRGTGV